MGKKASPATIGAFVVGAFVLLVAGVLIFGSGKLLSRSFPWVMYFDGSVKGLNVGAPVSFRGVKVGQVTDIKVVLDPTDATIHTPVFIEIEPDRVATLGERPPSMVHNFLRDLLALVTGESGDDDRPMAERLVQRGLRGQLAMQSLLTGQLFVQLDFHPNTPIRLKGLHSDYPEFPTIPSTMEEISEKLERIPLEDLTNGVVRAVQGIDRFIRSPELQRAVVSLDKTMQHISRLTSEFDRDIDEIRREVRTTFHAMQAALRQVEVTLALEKGRPGELADSLDATFKSAQSALTQAETTLAVERGAPGRLIASLTATSDSARTALIQGRTTLRTVDELLAEESPVRYQLIRTLSELSAAARSVRILSEYLERHPEALLTGKGRGGY